MLLDGFGHGAVDRLALDREQSRQDRLTSQRVAERQLTAGPGDQDLHLHECAQRGG